MSITVTLTPANRSGTCTSPLAALSLETIAFSGGVIADHTQVMVMLPDGSPLALGETLNGVCEINLKTKEAHSATAGIAAGELVRCVLVIGDTNTLRYVVPAQLQRNYLEDMIPPTESVPSYPDTEELLELLNAINAANADVTEKHSEVVSIANTFPVTVADAKAEIDRHTEDVTEEIMQAKTDAVQSASAAAGSASSASQSASSASQSAATVTGIKNELSAALEEAAGVADEVDELQADGRFEKWTGTVDSLDGVTDTMIGAKKLADNNSYPRLHARNKEIHGCKGFSNETDTHTGLELLLPWEVAKTNESSYLMAGVQFTSDRGMGGETPFVQPLLPEGYIPNFEHAPLYWIGRILYNDAQNPSQSAIKQVTIPWGKIPAGGSDTIALASDLEDLGGSGSVYDVVEVADNAIVLDPKVGYYYKRLDESEYTFVFDSTAFEVSEGEIAKINLLLEIGDVTPTVAFPANVYFSNNAPVFRPKTKMLIELTSANQGGFWIGRMAWTTSNYAYEVAYLTHSGTQYIDTGLLPKDDYVYKLKAECTSKANTTRTLFGRYYASGGRGCQFHLVAYADSRFQVMWNGATGRSEGTTLDDLTKLNAYVFDATGLSVNGAMVWEPGNVNPIAAGDLTMWLGDISGKIPSSTPFVGNIHNLSVEQNGEKVMDLIPVVDWSGVACWHDKVSGNNYYNNGTGKFEVGPRV